MSRFGPYSRTSSVSGSELTAAEIEFGRAMEQYKRLHHRPYPTFQEVLAVARSLGYCKSQRSPGSKALGS